MPIGFNDASRLSGIPRSTLKRRLSALARALDPRTGSLRAPGKGEVVVAPSLGAYRLPGAPWHFDEAIVTSIGMRAGDLLAAADLIPNWLDRLRDSLGVPRPVAIGAGKRVQAVGNSTTRGSGSASL